MPEGNPTTIERRAAYKQRWAEANREKVNAQKRAYATAHPDRVLKSKNECNARNKERYRREAAERKVANRDAINARNRELYAARHEPLIGRIVRRKERELRAEGAFTEEDEQKMLAAQDGKCANCRSEFTKTYHVDHILPLVHGGSHWPSNRQILCATCNHRKGVKLPEEWAQQNGRLF